MKIKTIVSTVSLGVLMSVSPLVLAQTAPPAETKNEAGGGSPDLRAGVPDRRDSRRTPNERTDYFNRTNIPTEAQNDGGGGPTSLQMTTTNVRAIRVVTTNAGITRSHFINTDG